jgi:hypothetical protein
MMFERNSWVPKRNSGAQFNKRRGGTLASLLIILATADAATAEGFYLDAGVVGSSLESDGFIEQLHPDIRGTGDTERSTGWRVASGYRISKSFSVEAGFADFGDKTPADAIFQYGNAYQLSHEGTRISMRGPYLALVGSLQIDHWAPFVKIGALRADTAITSHIVNRVSRPVRITQSRKVAASADTTELLLGIGVTYRITDHYGVALEATRVAEVGEADVTGQDDLTSLSLTAQYAF